MPSTPAITATPSVPAMLALLAPPSKPTTSPTATMPGYPELDEALPYRRRDGYTPCTGRETRHGAKENGSFFNVF
jgi:hypothetical protein